MLPTPEVLARGLDVLDQALFFLSADLGAVLHRNRRAYDLGEPMPEALRQAIDAFVRSRRDARQSPPALRVELDGRTHYLRVLAVPGQPPFEVALIREEILRDLDLFKLLSARYQVTRREYQVLTALRLGKTNRQIASELGVAEATVAANVGRLLERLDAPNRTRLVNLVEQLARHR